MKRKFLKILMLLALAPCLAIIVCNYRVNSYAENRTFSTVAQVPYNKVGLVLGTSKHLKGGDPNPYYDFRIAAATQLFQNGKISYVLVSGDNGSVYYNEPHTIKKDLVAAGIPEGNIFLDYAGFRTLDSMYRAKEVFGLEKVTVISQKFHNERAIYIASKKGLEAIGFNAKDIPLEFGLKVQLREYLARVKVFLDLALQTQPKFYGAKITIE